MTFRAEFLSPLLALFLLAGCGSGTDPGRTTDNGSAMTDPESLPVAAELRAVQLRLNWFPEAEHGGYYAALVHGYFEEAGLDVTILKGGPGVPVREEVATGRVEFGISNADQILVARAQEADIVGVFAPLQTSPRCIMVHEKSGITSFDDLKNLTLAINQNSSFGAFLKHKVTLEGCQFEPYPGNVSRFLLTDNFAQQAYVFSEPYMAKKEGGDPVTLLAADIGFNPYTSILMTQGNTIRNDGDLVRRFVAAVQRGWQTYLDDPSKTNAHIQSENPESDAEILALGAVDLKKLCAPPEGQPLGSMTAERWSTMARQLEECGFSEAGTLKPGEAFTTEFVARP
jgi:NitT/TauT family transport system substrate-binding protein